MKKGIINIIKNVGKSLALGVVDSVPIVNNIKSNLESELGGKGKIDFVRLSSAIISIIVIVAILLGKITIEDAKSILKLI